MARVVANWRDAPTPLIAMDKPASGRPCRTCCIEHVATSDRRGHQLPSDNDFRGRAVASAAVRTGGGVVAAHPLRRVRLALHPAITETRRLIRDGPDGTTGWI